MTSALTLRLWAMNSQTARLRRLVALAALSLSLLPATAVAQAPSTTGTRPTARPCRTRSSPERLRVRTSPARTRHRRPDTNGGDEQASLPFTGMDLGLLAGAGVLLVGLGTAVRLVLRLPPPVR